jgi:RNA methyltransferase, TrmH family
MQTEQITSIKDARVVEARELTTASGRSRLHKCLLEGVESNQWAMEAGMPIEHVFCVQRYEKELFYTMLRERRIPCYLVSEGILKKISDTSYLVPYLGVTCIPEELSTTENMGDFIVVLDRVQDHGNIGTIIRTASAFGIRDLVSTTSTLDVYYKKIVNASRGKAFDVRIKRYDTGSEAIADLKRRGYQVIATSPYARDIQSMAPLQAKPIALVVGNETEGIAADIVRDADIVVQIPMSGTVESLNVGVATGISLYELKFRMVLSMLIDYIRTNLGREVAITAKYIQMAFDAQLKRVGNLNGMQVILLMILICDQSMTMEQITRDTGTLGEERDALLKPLFEQGYMRYQSDDPNSVAITETGERILAHLWSVVERAEQAVLTGFSETEKEQFKAYLRRIQENCMRVIETTEG